MTRIACLLLLAAAAPSWGQSIAGDELAVHERTLRDNRLPTAGPGLLKFFRERTLSKEQISALEVKVDLLASDNYSERVKAASELTKAGQLAKPLLFALAKDPDADAEAIRRAEICLRKIAEGNETSLAVATAHLIAKHKPAQAASVLVNYLVFATEPAIIEAVQQTLNVVAVSAGKPDPALVAALKDASPAKRGGAGEALIRGGGVKLKPLMVHLLSDPTTQVRKQAALALVEARDRSAVAPLIQTISELPADQVWSAEDLLFRLAGEGAPAVHLDAKTKPAQVRAAWESWWDKNKDTVDLARLSQAPPLLGNTLVTQMVPGPGLNGKIVEMGPDKKINFQIDNLRYPVDAQVIGKDRVVIAEYFGNKVTERDFKGVIVWEKQVSMPIAVQSLPGGQTFIASRRQLILVDRTGKELFTHFAQNVSISAARRLRDGKMVLVTSGGQLQVLDPQGKELSTFQSGQVYNMGGNIDILPGGRFLLPLYRENRVVEYDAAGRVSWQASVNHPTSAVRLPGGNTLVVSMNNMRVLEINRDGQEVWSHQCEGRPWRARRR